MGETTEIAWCDSTFNPWSGCTKVSPGCANCYAERQCNRFPHLGEWGPGAQRIRTSEANWKKPLAWNRKADAAEARGMAEDNALPPKPRVFCGSLCDWLDPEVPAEWLADLLALIAATPHLDWLLLTKRPELFGERLGEACAFDDPGGKADPPAGACAAADWLNGVPPPNAWPGTTPEDQQRADERIPALLEIPAWVRFLSCEPLLGPVSLDGLGCGTCKTAMQYDRPGLATPFLPDAEAEDYDENEHGSGGLRHAGNGPFTRKCTRGIHWVICGGESGPNARPMHTEWARSLRDQCQAAGVPFFMKQMHGRTKAELHAIPEDLQIREFPW